MESFRTIIKGWLGKVLLVLFLTPLALVGIEGYFSGQGSADVAKTVNGQEISKADLDQMTKSYHDQYLSMVGGDETLLNQAYIQQTATDTLVSRALLQQQAEKLGISLSDAQIEQMLAQQPNFQQNGVFSQSLYENYLRSAGLTSQTLIQNIRQDHALRMLTNSINSTALVSKADINQIATLQTEQRTLQLASINLESEKNNIQVTDQEIESYYKAHPNKFRQVASVDANYVVLSPQQVVTNPPVVTEAELQQAYNAFAEKQRSNVERDVQHILITEDNRTDAEAQKLANEVYAQINSGRLSFADAAREYSDDTGSKEQAGRLAAYEKGVFSPEFDQAVDALGNDQISQPVKTQYGYHIIKVTAEAPVIPSFAQERERLTAELQKSKTANVYADTVNHLNDLIVSSDDLGAVTEEVASAQVQSFNGLTLAMQHPVLSDPAVKGRLFSDDVKNGDRNASSNIQLANGSTIWVKVRQYHPAGVMPFEQAKARVKAKLIEDKAFANAKAKIAKSIEAFKTQPAEQARASGQIAFEQAGVYTRSQGLKREIERAAFSVAPPKDGMWSVTTAHLPNELVVVAVTHVNSTTANALTPEQLGELSKLYQQFRGQQELDDYTQYLKSKAKIK